MPTSEVLYLELKPCKAMALNIVNKHAILDTFFEDECFSLF